MKAEKEVIFRNVGQAGRDIRIVQFPQTVAVEYKSQRLKKWRRVIAFYRKTSSSAGGTWERGAFWLGKKHTSAASWVWDWIRPHTVDTLESFVENLGQDIS